MTVRRYEKAMMALEDGRLSESRKAELESHLEQCEECQKHLLGMRAVRAAMTELGALSPPEPDWDRVDAGFEQLLRDQRQRNKAPLWFRHRGLALAGACALALLLSFFVLRPTGSPQTDDDAEGAMATSDQQHRVGDGVEATGPTEAAPIEAFVSYIVGQGGRLRPAASDESSPWSPLELSASVLPSARLRTEPGSAVGLQLGPDVGCRLGENSEVELLTATVDEARLELVRGQMTCRGAAESPIVVVSTLQIVASSRSRALLSIRRTEEMVFIELAEGVIRVESASRAGVDLTSPAQIALPLDEAASPDDRDELTEEARRTLAGWPITALTGPSDAALLVPPISGIERVEVDGVDYGGLPLSLMRPGATTARVELFPSGGGASIVEEVSIEDNGRASLDAAPILARLAAMAERRVAPRYGTLEPEQVRRVRSLVSSKVHNCFNHALKRDPTVRGRIRVTLTIGVSGQPRRPRVTTVSGNSGSVGQCVESGLSRQRFPTPRGGIVPVEQTITLSPRF